MTTKKVYVEKSYGEKPYRIFRSINNDTYCYHMDYTITKCVHKQNAELIAKILNDDENGISSVYKAWERYKGKDVI